MLRTPLLLIACSLLAACGLKGGLYLPEKTTTPVVITTAGQDASSSSSSSSSSVQP